MRHRKRASAGGRGREGQGYIGVQDLVALDNITPVLSATQNVPLLHIYNAKRNPAPAGFSGMKQKLQLPFESLQISRFAFQHKQQCLVVTIG